MLSSISKLTYVYFTVRRQKSYIIMQSEREE